jgi:hypothetical protein
MHSLREQLVETDVLRIAADILRDAGLPVDEWQKEGHDIYKNLVSLHRLFLVQTPYEFWSMVDKILARYDWRHKIDPLQGENVAWMPGRPYDVSDIHLLLNVLLPFFPEGHVFATYDHGTFWVVFARTDADVRLQVWDHRNTVPRHIKNLYYLACMEDPSAYWLRTSDRMEDRVTREVRARSCKGPSFKPVEGGQLLAVNNMRPTFQ